MRAALALALVAGLSLTGCSRGGQDDSRPLTVVLFAVLPSRRAVIVSFLAAWLFLPMATYPVPFLPDGFTGHVPAPGERRPDADVVACPSIPTRSMGGSAYPYTRMYRAMKGPGLINPLCEPAIETVCAP